MLQNRMEVPRTTKQIIVTSKIRIKLKHLVFSDCIFRIGQSEIYPKKRKFFTLLCVLTWIWSIETANRNRVTVWNLTRLKRKGHKTERIGHDYFCRMFDKNVELFRVSNTNGHVKWNKFALLQVSFGNHVGTGDTLLTKLRTHFYFNRFCQQRIFLNLEIS